jgi:hypothetical protein
MLIAVSDAAPAAQHCLVEIALGRLSNKCTRSAKSFTV